MLGVKNEQDIESPCNLGVRLEVEVGLLGIHHVKEIFNITKILIGWDNWFTSTMSVASSCDSRSTSENSVNVLVSFLLILINISSDISGVTLRIELTHTSN